MNLKLKVIFATILSLMILCVTSSVFAVDVTVGSLSVSADANVTQGKEFTVNINLSNFKTSAEAVVISGKIEYDKDKLEYVSGSLASNRENGWTVTFSESKMVFLSENMDPANVEKNSNMLTLKFKAKSNVEGTASIKVTSTSASDATNFNGGSTSVTISKPVEEQDGNQDEEQGGNQGNEQGGNQDEEQGGNQGNEQGGNQGEEQGGNQGNEQGGNQGNEQGGNQGNEQGGNQGEEQSGSQDNEQSENQGEQQTEVQGNNDNKEVSSENTTTKGTLPATGDNSYLNIVLANLSIIAIISIIYFCKVEIKK